MFRGARIGEIHIEAVPKDFDAFMLVSPGGYTRSSGVRRDDTQRPSQHGSFSARGYRDGATFSFKGVAKRRTALEMEHLERAVRRIGGDGGWERLSIDEGLGARWADVGLASVDFDVLGVDPTIAEFQLQFWSPDPRLYGPAADFPAGSAAFNRGNFPASPRLMIGAGAGGYTVLGPNGRVISVTSAPAGAHEIDFTAGGLYLNGVRQVGALSVFQPWEIPPGIPGMVASISGARSLIQRVTDTFI